MELQRGFPLLAQQYKALFSKNLLLSWRNKRATFLQLFSSLFFILLIFLIQQAIESSYSSSSSFESVTDPAPLVAPPIPPCEDKFYTRLPCYDFVWSGNNSSRISEIVRRIRDNNPGRPIPERKVRAFTTPNETDDWLASNPMYCPGALHFVDRNATVISYGLQTNSTPLSKRGNFEDPTFKFQIPLQLAAEREIARSLIGDASFSWVVSIKEFAHPAREIFSAVQTAGPIFFLAIAMFSFVFQISALVTEKELKLRQAMTMMGLYDTAYWLSWLTWEGLVVLLSSLFTVLFGMMFQFDFFLNNSFAVVFLLFFLFQLNMESSSLPSKNIGIGSPNNSINHDEDMVSDYTYVFTTHDLFPSREKLFDWVRERGREHGMVIVINRSDSGTIKRRPSLLLACERSGQYRGFKGKSSQGIYLDNSVKEDDVCKLGKKIASRRETGSKKCDCPFRLMGKQKSAEGEWFLEVKCGVHNHPTAQYLEGHSYAGRLTKTEEEYIMDMSHNNTRPKDILFGLQQKFEGNKSTIRTIYNARLKNKVIERDGRSQMQQLMWKLEKHGYVYHDRRCMMSNTVKDLFFAHPKSIDLLRSFPKVLLMDCTYKTNRYKLPLLEIVGVTPTNMTFSIAAVYMEFEREDNYTWACMILKSLMDSSSLPNVIVTDREVALINAIEKIFPTSSKFLCRWHINRNIVANCKKMFRNKDSWDSFILYWNMLVISDNETSFYDMLEKFQSKFMEVPAAVKYVMDQWLGPYKERFVSCWTNNIMHFDNTTTNRVESEHAKLKRQLGSSQGNFETCWGQIHRLFETSHNAIKQSFEKSRNVVLHKYKSGIFILLRGMVTISALNKIYDEMKFVTDGNVDPLLCGCVLRKTCGLPCSHEIFNYVKLEKPIPLEQVDAFWRKMDFLPRADVGVGHEIETQLGHYIGILQSNIRQAPGSDKLFILKKLMEIVNPTITPLIDPDIKTRPRGRPKSIKPRQCKSTKRDPSKFEYVESIKDSCSPHANVIFDVGPSNNGPMFTSKPRTKLQVVRQKTHSTDDKNFMDQLPSHLHSYIVRTKNVVSDGHCGFRAIAELMGYNEESWGRVRGDLYHELSTNREFYSNVFIECGVVDKILMRLNYYEDRAPKNHWFSLPEMGYLVASKYNVALVCLDNTMSLTYLPLRTSIPCTPKMICIGFINKNHFIEVFLREGRPLPPVTTTWDSFRYDVAAGWKDFYSESFILYKESV